MAQHTNIEFHAFKQVASQRVTLHEEFYSTRPRWLGYNQVYRHFAHPRYKDCLFVKFDDDIVFMETDRLSEYLAVIEAHPGAIVSADVINNGACARHQPGLWDQFEAIGEPQLDWHIHNKTAVMAHEHFFEHHQQLLNQPIRTIETEDWLSINMIGYNWETGKLIAERIGTPSPPCIAGRGFSNKDWIGDEGMSNLLPRIITKGFTVAHLSYRPQDLTNQQEDTWRHHYEVIGRTYLGEQQAREPISVRRIREVRRTRASIAARRTMPKYRIVRPCAYVGEDGIPVYHRTPGTIVELTVDAARRLGARVALVPLAEIPQPEPEPQSESEPISEPEN